MPAKLRVLLGLCILGALVYSVGPATLGRQILAIDPRWIGAAFVMVLISALLGATAIYLLLTRDRSLPWAVFLPIYWMGWALNLVTPGQIGDIAGISSLLRRRDYEWHTSIGRSVVDKATSILVIGAAGSGGLWLAARHSLAASLVNNVKFIALAAACGMGFALLTYYLVNSSAAGANIRRFLGQIWSEMVDTVHTSRSRLLGNVFLTVIKVLATGFAYWCVFRSLGSSPSATAVILISAAASLVAYVPISFNGVGTVEFTGVLLFAAIGLQSDIVVSTYLVLRAVVIISAWVPATLWLALSKPRVYTRR